MDKRKAVGVDPIRTVALLVLIAVLFTAAFLLFKKWEDGQSSYPVNDNTTDPVISHGGKEYAITGDVETDLVIGLDTSGKTEDNTAYNNDKLADFLLLLVFDNKESTVSAIQINRDTIAEINRLDIAGNKIDTINRQIALAHTYGNGKEVSCRNTADAVSSLLMNIKIDRYFSVTMDAVKEYNDLLGGVSVEILDDLTSIDPAMIKGETVKLTGEQALSYVRARQGLDDSTNIRRMERQRQYLHALYDVTKQRIGEDEEFSVSAASSMAKHMVSNCTVHQLQTVINKIATYSSTKIYELEGESLMGETYMEFYPDKEHTKRLVIDLFYKQK